MKRSANLEGFRPGPRFTLRAGVAVDLRAPLAVAAQALPEPNTATGLIAELAAAERQGRKPRGWLTLREAAALLGLAFHETYYQLKNIDDDQVGPPKSLRSVGAWELVPATVVHRYRTRFKIAPRSVESYAVELAAESARQRGDRPRQREQRTLGIQRRHARRARWLHRGRLTVRLRAARADRVQ